jgi:hypothetical protein
MWAGLILTETGAPSQCIQFEERGEYKQNQRSNAKARTSEI